MNATWSEKLEQLRRTRYKYHNDDYLEFLVDRVWKLHQPCRLLDCGCGFGYMGLKLLPLLPAGSTYTGVDEAVELLDEARAIFANLPYETNFIEADIHAVPLEDDTFDVALSHTVLMHLEHPQKALAEMVRLTRPGGLVITCESNWNAVNALTHIHELDKLDTTDLGFLQRLFARDHKATGRDGNIGAKMPLLLHQAGLKNIDARITDAVRCLFPPLDTDEKKELYQSFRADGLGQNLDAEREGQLRARFVERDFTPEEVEGHIRKEKYLADHFVERGEESHIVFPLAMMFSFGEVDKVWALCYHMDRKK